MTEVPVSVLCRDRSVRPWCNWKTTTWTWQFFCHFGHKPLEFPCHNGCCDQLTVCLQISDAQNHPYCSSLEWNFVVQVRLRCTEGSGNALFAMLLNFPRVQNTPHDFQRVSSATLLSRRKHGKNRRDLWALLSRTEIQILFRLWRCGCIRFLEEFIGIRGPQVFRLKPPWSLHVKKCWRLLTKGAMPHSQCHCLSALVQIYTLVWTFSVCTNILTNLEPPIWMFWKIKSPLCEVQKVPSHWILEKGACCTKEHVLLMMCLS